MEFRFPKVRNLVFPDSAMHCLCYGINHLFGGKYITPLGLLGFF